MTTYLQAYFSRLKSCVLEKSKISYIVPADCYRLALEIKVATNKSVSETTLKRIFGFASSIHQPSNYTLNALAEYCGFDGWEGFCAYMEHDKLGTSLQKPWVEIALNAMKISLFSIQSNKYKCGIPYHLTIDREYMNMFIEHFTHSGATTGILSGPVGYGKTVAISRWVEKGLSQSHISSTNDIHLFTNGLSLLQGTAFGYHCNNWLARLLGFENSDLLDIFMENYRNAAPGHFYLIIDELHNDLVSDRQFHTVISQFIEMTSHFAQYKWFRIILVLRTVTLRKYESLFRNTISNQQWFSVLGGNPNNKIADMCPFSTPELYQLTCNLAGTTKPYPGLPSGHNHLVDIPLFFQYYYELYGDKLDLDNITSFDEYLVIGRYLKRKVFNGINTMAKQALIEELSPLIEQANGSLQISKRQAYHAIKQYRTTYNDLIYTGVIHETTNGLELRQQAVIQFQSNTIGAYFWALHLFNKNMTIDQLIQEMNRSTFSRGTKIKQLKWLLLFYLELGDTQLANQVEHIHFIEEEGIDTGAFIRNGINKFGKHNDPFNTVYSIS